MLCPKCKKSIPDDALLCCYCGKKIVEAEKKHRKRANGSGTVYKLSGKRTHPWAAARNRVMIGTFATRAEALRKLETLSNKPVGDAYNLTLCEVHTLWEAEHSLDVANKTMNVYAAAWKRMQPLERMKMRDVRTEHVQDLIDAEVQDGRSRSQCEKIRSLYSQLCQYAMKRDIIDRNYATFLRMPKKKEKVRLVFTQEDIQLIRAEAQNNETAKLIMILIYTGFRINELMLLPLSGVDLPRRILVGGEKTEAGKNRTVPILPAIYQYVEYFYAAANGPLLISGYHGNQDAHNFRSRDFCPFLERLGIRTPARPFTPHCCRYTFATMAASAGLDPEALKRILGHKKYETTSDIYIQDDVDHLQEEMQKLTGY